MEDFSRSSSQRGNRYFVGRTLFFMNNTFKYITFEVFVKG